jgi:hypothetical protein
MGALDSLYLIWGFLRLAGKAPSVYTRMYLARRRATGAFKKQLVACGVDAATAKELASFYPRIELLDPRSLK